MNVKPTAHGSYLYVSAKLKAMIAVLFTVCTTRIGKTNRVVVEGRSSKILMPAAVKAVAEHLDFDPILADECIADLPPVEL